VSLDLRNNQAWETTANPFYLVRPSDSFVCVIGQLCLLLSCLGLAAHLKSDHPPSLGYESNFDVTELPH
jgi:hypothetical protein